MKPNLIHLGGLLLATTAAAENDTLEPVTLYHDAGNIARSASGLEQPLTTIPQSVSIITTKQTEAQGIRTLDRALLQATGVSQRIWGSNRATYNNLYARGSEIHNYQLDGLPLAGAPDSGNMGTSAYEQIEITRGISSLNDGGGEPGASVNLVRKRPDGGKNISLGAGSRKQYRLQSDLSAPLNHDGTLRGRSVLDLQRGDGWRYREKNRAASLYAILEYDLAAQTTAEAGIQLEEGKQHAAFPHSLSAYDNQGYPTHFNYRDNPVPDWAYSRARSLNLFTGLQHRINDDWQTKIQYNYRNSRWDAPYGIAGVLNIEHERDSGDFISGYWHTHPVSHSASAIL